MIDRDYFDMVKFIKRVIISNSTDSQLREEGLELYCVAINGMKEVSVAGSKYRFTTLEYDEIQAFLQEGKKILAIKAFRTVSGLGLKDSKEAIENVENFTQHIIKVPED